VLVPLLTASAVTEKLKGREGQLLIAAVCHVVGLPVSAYGVSFTAVATSPHPFSHSLCSGLAPKLRDVVCISAFPFRSRQHGEMMKRQATSISSALIMFRDEVFMGPKSRFLFWIVTRACVR